MIDLDTIMMSTRIEGVNWTIDDFLRTYDAVLTLWEEHGWTPDRVAGVRASRSGYYDAFDASRRHPRTSDITLTDGIAIEKMIDGWRYDGEWTARISLSNYQGKGWAAQALGATQLQSTQEITLDVSRRFLRVVGGQYAYILRQQRRYGYYELAPTMFDAFLERPRDHSTNISRWSSEPLRSVQSLLLRDIYPYNYLNDAYLDAPFGKTAMTLREWIESDPADRGELRPFTEILTEWTPPDDNIPKIREQLFRAGRIFYWRFFCPQREDDPSNFVPNPFYRADLRESWEAPEPIPEIYRAEFYKDKDPGLIY